MITEIDTNNPEKIALELKTIPFTKVLAEWNKLSSLTLKEIEVLNGRNKIGCDFIDYYFFTERLMTIGNKGITFMEFLKDLEIYKQKHYIQTLLTFCENNNRYVGKPLARYYYIYGLCFGRINAFKITNALRVYKKYKPSRVIDPFAGFGGRLVGAMIENIDYKGYDINVHLSPIYAKLLNDFSSHSTGNHIIHYCDSSVVNYEEVSNVYPYDMVFTSPPYKNIEIYRCCTAMTDKEWHDLYVRTFTSLWKGLIPGGWMIININMDIYTSSLECILGECTEKTLLTKTKKNSYDEYVYAWKKPSLSL